MDSGEYEFRKSSDIPLFLLANISESFLQSVDELINGIRIPSEYSIKTFENIIADPSEIDLSDKEYFEIGIALFNMYLFFQV